MASTKNVYRLPVASSSYHEKCIAPSVKAMKEAMARVANDKNFSEGAYRDCNVVAQERIWTEAVQREHSSSKEWSKNWEFLVEHDGKGKKHRPHHHGKVSYYSKTVSPSASHEVGSRVQSPYGKRMLQLERLICHRKRKTDLEKYNC